MAATTTRADALPRTLPRLAAAATLVRRTLAETAAVVQVVLGGAVVLAAAERRSVLASANRGAFTSWFAGPLHGLWPSLTTDPLVLKRDLHHALFAMLAAWLVVLLGGRSVRAGVVIAAVVALNVVFFLCPPSGLTDLFNYLGYARLDVVHHLNPYVDVPLAQRGDPVYAYSNWHRLRSPYGPLFTLLLLPTAKLPLPVAYWTYKAAATAGSLALLAGVWACARRLGRAPAPAVAFVGLNPLVLVYALGGKHNDLIMMACVMAGCLLVLTRREALGGATLAAAVAIKASAGLLAPVIALGAPRRLRAVAGLAAGALALEAVAYPAFGPHLPDLRDQSRLVNAFSVPQLLGYATGHGGADPQVRRIALIAMLSGGALCAAYAWRTRHWATAAGWAGLLTLACTSWLEPWYVLWALPLAAVSRSRTLRLAVLVTTTWLVLTWGGVVPTYAHDHGYRPHKNAVGRVNRHFEYRHLTDPRRHEMRDHHRRSGRRHILPRLRGSAARPSPARRARPQASHVLHRHRLRRRPPGAPRRVRR